VGIEVVVDEAYTRLEALAARSVSVWPAQGRPAEASCAVGRLVPAEVRQALSVDRIPGGVTATITGVDAATVSDALTGELADGVSPHVADVAAMAGSVPVGGDELKDYQREIVGVHLATGLGFVNALPTGMGKTITTLAAFRTRARERAGWRGLVVVEANVRTQWAEQARQWFPDAVVHVVASRADAGALAATLSSAKDRPVLVICSYALAADAADASQGVAVDDNGQFRLFADGDAPVTGSELGRVLVGTAWDDLVADEAIGLRNTGTKLASALWRLRSVSQVAVALTGTPITRGLDDLGRLIAWTRGDAELFRGARLERSFDLSDDDDLASYLRAIGPLVQRRDKSELDGEIPQLAPSVIRLDPTPAEKHLATAARVELKRVYDELVAHMELAEAARGGEDAAALATAREALVAARGAWLGGTQLARMASSDPEALIGSQSAGAALLAAQGLVDAACEDGGTKRQWCVAYCTERVEDGDQVLVFTEFASVARRLIAELRDAGLSVGAVLGGGGAARDRDVAAFRAGELSVLVSTSAGERGLNLQVANAIVHYDLPWTPDGVVQRTGRVQRIGAGTAPVSVVFPIMSGTVEERVASMVVARAVTSLRALDSARGVEARNSELGRALGELAGSVTVDEVGGGHARMLAITRELLG
jgi:SNF2 family DNA or RNA helicase